MVQEISNIPKSVLLKLETNTPSIIA